MIQVFMLLVHWEFDFQDQIGTFENQLLPTRISEVIITPTGANRAATLRKGGNSYVTFCADNTICCASHCLPISQRTEALTQVRLTRQSNMARHTPCRMSHEQPDAPLMAFCLQGISPMRQRHRIPPVIVHREMADRVHESVRFVASNVGYLLLTNGRLKAYSRLPIRHGGIKIDIREQTVS